MTKARARQLVIANHPDNNGGRWKSRVARQIFEKAVKALKRRYNKCVCGVTIVKTSVRCATCEWKFRRATKLQLK